MKAHEYADLVAAYLLANYGARGLSVYREISLGKSVIGKNRRLDIFALHEPSGRALAIECKCQEVSGTADEKIPYTLQDLAAMHIPAFVVYAGRGFSDGVLHLLRGSALAAYCLPPETLEPTQGDTTELDHIVAMTFGWWDAIVQPRRAFDLEAWRKRLPRASAEGPLVALAAVVAGASAAAADAPVVAPQGDTEPED